MKEWFASLETRERTVVIAGAGAVLLMLLYALIVHPALAALDAARRDTQAARDGLRELRVQAEQVRQLRARLPALPEASASLVSGVEDSLQAGALHDGVQRLQPDGEQVLRVTLANVDFDAVLRWLERVPASTGGLVADLVIERAGDGSVNVRATIERKAP